jgi:hypothetical protein
MKITLDHNCIIDLASRTEVGRAVEAVVSNPEHECFVVNIGASEMREFGIRPDCYSKFEELLEQAGIIFLPRLNPMLIYDVTFWDRCVWGSNRTIQLAEQIESVLFGKAAIVDIRSAGIDSPEGKKWLNRLCDIHSMWCHIQNENDIFLTSDVNFKKLTKLPKLQSLGARRICTPGEL